jgi:hypothetical protein
MRHEVFRQRVTGWNERAEWGCYGHLSILYR